MYDKSQEVLNGKFSIRKHKETFIDYLEVVISPDGVIEYAVPSHTVKLTHILMEKWNCGEEDVFYHVPRKFFGDIIAWLTMESGYIAVWNDRYVGFSNNQQQIALGRLAANGIYHGPRHPNSKQFF